MKKPARAVLNTYTRLKPKKNRRQADGTLTTHCEVVIYLLSTYAKDDVIAELDVEKTTSKQPPNMNHMDYSQSLWLKALKCGSVYKD